MFSQAESAEISDKYTAVHLNGGNDLDDEGKAFMSRYGVSSYPTMLAMTADGAVIGRRFERSTQGILAAMEGAAAANEAFLEKEAVLAKKTDTDSVRELAGLYFERAQYEQAREGLERLLGGKDPQVEDQVMMLDTLTRLSDQEARKKLLAVLIETRREDERNIRWRMDLATSDLPTSVTSREEWEEVMGKRKEALTQLLPQVEKPADQAVVRNSLAQILARTGDREAATAHWDWILENARDSEAAADALMMSAQMAFQAGRAGEDVAKLKACIALLQEIVDKHPDHPAANGARQGIPQVEGLIAALEKKAADAAAADEDDDSSEEDDEDSDEDDEDSDEDDESSDDEDSDEDDE